MEQNINKIKYNDKFLMWFSDFQNGQENVARYLKE